MQSTCKPSQGEEGGTYTREPSLQLPSAGMQLFRMGPSGAGEVAEHAKEGAGSQIKEREDSVLMMQQSLHEGVRNLVGTVVEQAEQRHQEVMESQHAQHVKHERSHRDGGLFRASGGEDRRAFWNESRPQF